MKTCYNYFMKNMCKMDKLALAESAKMKCLLLTALRCSFENPWL